MYTLTCYIMMSFDLLGLHLNVVVHVLLQFPPSMNFDKSAISTCRLSPIAMLIGLVILNLMAPPAYN